MAVGGEIVMDTLTAFGLFAVAVRRWRLKTQKLRVTPMTS
jgi:hypothetical protein